MKRVLALLICLMVVSPVFAATINPNTEGQTACQRYWFLKPICGIVGGGGSGSSISVSNLYVNNSTANVTFFNESIFGDYSIWNITEIAYLFNNTFKNLTIVGDVVYYSEMNQTVNMTANMTAGPAGADGAQGPPGIDGLNNMTAGPAGPQGVNGTEGAPGPQGIQGEQGIQGIQGLQGPAGEQGPQGEQGPPGADGAANMTAGPQGEQGIQGIQGEQGPAGPTGPMNQTPNMTAGPQGPAGPTGPAGLDANVSTMWPINSVFVQSVNNTPTFGGTWVPFGYNTSNSSTIIPALGGASGFGFSIISDTNYGAGLENWRAFDKSGSTKWASTATAVPHYIGFYSGDKYVINNYSITGGYDTTSGNPTAWMFNASNDNSTWTTLDTQSGISWTSNSQVQTFTFQNKDGYNYYRLVITADVGSSYAAMTQLNLYDGVNGPFAFGPNVYLYFWRRTA